MAGPYEIVDDLTQFLSETRTVFKVSKPPYVPGSIHVYLDSLLQLNAYFAELDPVAGTFEIAEPHPQRSELDAGLHVSYLTFIQPYVDPAAPIHISQLKDGDVVRIALKPGQHLEPVPMRKGLQHRLEIVPKPRMVRAHSQTVFLGNITGNDRTNGILNLQVMYRSWGSQIYAATVPYKSIKVIRKYITPAIPQTRQVPLGGGPNAIRRPGIVAKGFSDSAGFMRLILVKF